MHVNFYHCLTQEERQSDYALLLFFTKTTIHTTTEGSAYIVG